MSRIQTLTFVKDLELGDWLFHAPFEVVDDNELRLKPSFQMMLEIMSGGKPTVELEVFTAPIDGFNRLRLIQHYEENGKLGAVYQPDKAEKLIYPERIYLDNIFSRVFKRYMPFEIYYKLKQDEKQ